MACIEKIYSVSALVGSSVCNGKCKFCAATELRKQAPDIHNLKMPSTFKSAIKLSARYGGWSLSLTSSGEPTCSPIAVTNALKDYDECAKEGAYFPNVNLFTNGMNFADPEFCEKYLPTWRGLGLTAVAVSIHGLDEEDQANAYGLRTYPNLKEIFSNIRKYDLQCRATLLLRKGSVDNYKKFEQAIHNIQGYGVKNISSWMIANSDGSRSDYSPSRLNMAGIRLWLRKNAKLCHGHVWGGGVYDYKGTIVRLTDYVTKHDPKKDYVRQLVVFQDGTVAYSWIREGALCFST